MPRRLLLQHQPVLRHGRRERRIIYTDKHGTYASSPNHNLGFARRSKAPVVTQAGKYRPWRARPDLPILPRAWAPLRRRTSLPAVERGILERLAAA